MEVNRITYLGNLILSADVRRTDEIKKRMKKANSAFTKTKNI